MFQQGEPDGLATTIILTDRETGPDGPDAHRCVVIPAAEHALQGAAPFTAPLTFRAG